MRGRRLLFAADYSLSELESSIPGISGPCAMVPLLLFSLHGSCPPKNTYLLPKSMAKYEDVFLIREGRGGREVSALVNKIPPKSNFLGSSALLCPTSVLRPPDNVRNRMGCNAKAKSLKDSGESEGESKQ